MAVLNVVTNIDEVIGNLQQKIADAVQPDYLLRPIAFDVVDLMTNRIHIDGKAADGGPIGTYSKGYMAVRTGNFKNAEKFSRGAKKGKIKNAGIVTKKKVQLFGTTQDVFADISSLGVARENYNRSSDTKIIVSLTRQLENDWSVIATEKGYGVGFKNSFNLDKARWVEAIKKKEIFSLTVSERKYAVDLATELVHKALNA